MTTKNVLLALEEAKMQPAQDFDSQSAPSHLNALFPILGLNRTVRNKEDYLQAVCDLAQTSRHAAEEAAALKKRAEWLQSHHVAVSNKLIKMWGNPIVPSCRTNDEAAKTYTETQRGVPAILTKRKLRDAFRMSESDESDPEDAQGDTSAMQTPSKLLPGSGRDSSKKSVSPARPPSKGTPKAPRPAQTAKVFQGTKEDYFSPGIADACTGLELLPNVNHKTLTPQGVVDLGFTFDLACKEPYNRGCAKIRVFMTDLDGVQDSFFVKVNATELGPLLNAHGLFQD